MRGRGTLDFRRRRKIGISAPSDGLRRYPPPHIATPDVRSECEATMKKAGAFFGVRAEKENGGVGECGPPRGGDCYLHLPRFALPYSDSAGAAAADSFATISATTPPAEISAKERSALAFISAKSLLAASIAGGVNFAAKSM